MTLARSAKMSFVTCMTMSAMVVAAAVQEIRGKTGSHFT